MRTVLFISYYYPPSVDAGAKRAEGFARYLPEHGFHPIVLTVRDGNYETASQPPLVDPPWVVRVAERRWMLRRRRGGCGPPPVAPARVPFTTRLAKRLVHEFLYCPDAYRGFHQPAYDEASRILREHEVDVLLTTSSPFTLLRTGHALSSRKGVPWVADLRDLWTQNHFGYPNSPVRRWIDARMERRWLSGAARITTATRGLARILATSGYGRIPIQCVYNGFFERTPTVARSVNRGLALTICYTGTLHDRGGHDAVAFFDALARFRELRPTAPVRVEFYGAVNAGFQSQVERFGLREVVTFKGPVTREEAQRRQEEADVLLLLLPDTASQSVIVPSKTFDYLAARRAILALAPTDGEAAHLLREAAVTRIHAPSDRDGIAAALVELADLKSDLRHVPPEGEVDRVGEFSYRMLAGRLAGVLEAAIKEGRGKTESNRGR